eukprot:1160705-Pelagomonas_calceolata.AAC.25
MKIDSTNFQHTLVTADSHQDNTIENSMPILFNLRTNLPLPDAPLKIKKTHHNNGPGCPGATCCQKPTRSTLTPLSSSGEGRVLSAYVVFFLFFHGSAVGWCGPVTGRLAEEPD